MLRRTRASPPRRWEVSLTAVRASGMAGTDKKQGQILHRRVVADDQRATDVTVDELEPPQESVGTRVVDRLLRLDPACCGTAARIPARVSTVRREVEHRTSSGGWAA